MFPLLQHRFCSGFLSHFYNIWLRIISKEMILNDLIWLEISGWKWHFYPCTFFWKQRNVMCQALQIQLGLLLQGVSSSEAPPYLLLWHLIENKNSSRTLFLRILKTLKTKHAIVFKSWFLVFPWKISIFTFFCNNALKRCSKKTWQFTIISEDKGTFLLDCPSAFLSNIVHNTNKTKVTIILC